VLSGPVAVGDSGLYYVWCDKGCLTADKQGRGVVYNRRSRWEALIRGRPALPATLLSVLARGGGGDRHDGGLDRFPIEVKFDLTRRIYHDFLL
jgi:hypothetical protein